MFFTKGFKPTEEMTRQEMIEYLMGHFTYWTMNSWNKTTSYANNVKIYNLGLSEELMDKAYDAIDLLFENDTFLIEWNTLKLSFCENTGCDIGFNGRSDGYLVLYPKWCGGLDEYEDFEDWETEDIVERVDLVKEFDKFCDDARDLFIYYLENGEVVEVEKVIVKQEKEFQLTWKK